MEDKWPVNNAEDILREAGRQLALIHEVPVEGFGWIDRNSYGRLKGVHPAFRDFFDEDLPEGLDALRRFEFTPRERETVTGLMETARNMLDVPQAVLVHGDFDVSHIFHANGRYTGIIDLGEIRGSNPLWDLATCALFDGSPGRTAYRHVLEGYHEVVPLDEDDRYAIELFYLFRTVVGMGGNADRPRLAGFFYHRCRDQLEWMGIVRN